MAPIPVVGGTANHVPFHPGVDRAVRPVLACSLVLSPQRLFEVDWLLERLDTGLSVGRNEHVVVDVLTEHLFTVDLAISEAAVGEAAVLAVLLDVVARCSGDLKRAELLRAVGARGGDTVLSRTVGANVRGESGTVAGIR